MSENSQDSQHLFKLAQFLGPPKIFPPVIQGKVPVSVKFIIPELKLGKSDKKNVTQLANKCGVEVYDIDTEFTENKRTKGPATLITFAFYIPSVADEAKIGEEAAIASRLLIERFLGLFSFFAGSKLSAVHTQVTTISKEGHYNLRLSPIERGFTSPTKVEFPNLENIDPSEDIWSALVWLRRGLAERDPVDTFSALMVCLQIIARHIVKQQPIVSKCPSCGEVLKTQEPSITSIVRELVVTRLGANPNLFDRLWKARSAIIAHGNRPLTAEVFVELTELKFDAANLAFQGIKLGLGIPIASPPSPNQTFSITDAFMYVD